MNDDFTTLLLNRDVALRMSTAKAPDGCLIWVKGIVLGRSKVKLLVIPTEHEEDAMKIATMLALGAVMFTASISATLAGPCSADIDAMMAKIDAALNARAATGPGAQQQSTVAGRHVQPTPNSMAAAEAKVGGMSPETIEQIRGSMARARTADAAGDNVACKEALAEVQSVHQQQRRGGGKAAFTESSPAACLYNVI